jgi:excisionase family DNA binding protein
MKAYLKWLRQRMNRLGEICDYLDIEPTMVQDVYIEAGGIAQEAGERAAKLGLPELHAESVALKGVAEPDAVWTFLAKCIRTCEQGMPKTDLLTVAAVAKRLGVKSTKVLGWISAGELKATNVAKTPGTKRKYKVEPTELEAFLERRKVSYTAKPASQRRQPLPPGVERFY